MSKIKLQKTLHRQDAIDESKGEDFNEKSRQTIIENFAFLVDHVSPLLEDLLDYIQSIGLLNDDFCATIRRRPSEKAKARELLTILVKSSHPTACYDFLHSALCPNSFVPGAEFIMPSLEKNKKLRRVLSLDLSEEELRTRIQSKERDIANSVHIPTMLDKMIELLLITPEQRSSIERFLKAGTSACIRKFLEILDLNSNNILKYTTFMEFLVEKYDYIANLIS